VEQRARQAPRADRAPSPSSKRVVGRWYTFPVSDAVRAAIAAQRVLIVEDDESARLGLTELVRTWGFTVAAAADGEQALTAVTEFRPTIVVSDLVMPRMDGLQLLAALGDDLAHLYFVLLTAQGTVETAVDALKRGAEDYLTKPVDPQRLRHLLERLSELSAARRENTDLRRRLREEGRFGRMVGASREMRKVYNVVEQAAPTTASVLIIGESGTGKELVAQTLHQLSPRTQQPYVAINCAAIPETLLESEIFGHEKGAFTGAYERRAGCFELADRGTLFLDEIAEMVPATQVKLLRVLQERRFRRLGGRAEQDVDVRVIAATNAEPSEAVRSGKLREDLYYRLNVFTIALPPLRDRREDLPLLVQTFLEEFNQRDEKAVKAIDPEAMRRLEAYGWPGNVRELRNVIERAVILAKGDFIESRHLPPLATAERRAAPAAAAGVGEVMLTPGMTVDEAEQKLILATLDAAAGNKTRAAEMLGISLKTLHNKLNRMKQGA
jgi:DNA-binding NtrC family response regulator